MASTSHRIEIQAVHALPVSLSAPSPAPSPVPEPSPPPVVPVNPDPTIMNNDLVFAAHPVVVNSDGTIADPEALENEGGRVCAYAGYSVDVGSTTRTEAFGASMILSAGGTTPEFDESGGGGDILFETGRVEVTNTAPDRDPNAPLLHNAHGATLRMTAGSVDPVSALDSGGTIVLSAGELYNGDGTLASGGKVSIYGARGHQAGSVSLEAGLDGSGQSATFQVVNGPEQGILAGDTFQIMNERCTQADESGRPGSIRWDKDYLYVCAENNTWKRIPLKAFQPEIENFGDELRMGRAFIRFVHEEAGSEIEPRIQIGVGDSVVMEFMAGDDPYVAGFQTPVRINNPFMRITGSFTIPTPDAPGANGTFCADQDYLYYCYADNQWGRIAWTKTW